jgi:hypothetical protein
MALKLGSSQYLLINTGSLAFASTGCHGRTIHIDESHARLFTGNFGGQGSNFSRILTYDIGVWYSFNLSINVILASSASRRRTQMLP